MSSDIITSSFVLEMISSSFFENLECNIEESQPVIRDDLALHNYYSASLGQNFSLEAFLVHRGFRPWLAYFTKDKIDQNIKVILLGIWHQHIMEPGWEQHNNILHKGDNIINFYLIGNYYPQNVYTTHNNTSHTSPRQTSSNGQHNTKKHTSYFLQTAHRNYEQQLNDKSKFQPVITLQVTSP